MKSFIKGIFSIAIEKKADTYLIKLYIDLINVILLFVFQIIINILYSDIYIGLISVYIIGNIY